MKNPRLTNALKAIPTDIWERIAQIDQLQGMWISGAKLDPQALGRLKRSVLVTSTGASTRIEGAKLTDQQIERAMSGLKVKKFLDRDSQEVRGYYELLKNVFESWQNLKLSESLIKHFHQELLKYVDKDQRHRGEYKKVNNSVELQDRAGRRLGIIFETTPPYLTPKQMQELVQWTKATFSERSPHRLLTIGAFLVEFLAIHPFQDGNGRLSRILTNLLLLQAGYEYMPYVSHEKLVEDSKADYYLALRQTQKTIGSATADLAPWLRYFLGIVLRQSAMAVGLLSQENIEKLLSPKQLAVWQYLQTVTDASPNEIARHAKVARPTVNQALDKLTRLQRVERFGLGRATRYRTLS